MTSRLQNMHGINGIKFLLQAKDNRVRKSIGLTHTYHVEKDALVDHVRTVGDNRTVINNFKRKFDGPIDTDKTQADNISRFVKRLRTEVNKPSDIPDFVIEESDGSVKFSLKKEKNILKYDDSEEDVSEEDVSVTITKDEIDSIEIPEPADSSGDTSVFSFGDKSGESTGSTISIISLGKPENINTKEINTLFDEVPVPITSDDSTAYTSSTISSKSMFTEKDTSYREINIDKSVFDSYIKGKQDGIKILNDEITKIKGEIDHLKSCIDAEQFSVSSDPSTISGRSIIKPDRFKDCINPEKGIPLTEKIEKKRKELQYNEEQLDKKYKLIDGAVSVPTVDNTIKPLIVSDIEGFLMRNYGTTFPRHHATTMENVKLIDKAIMISNLFKDLSSYEDQLKLYKELSEEDRNYFTISDEEMEEFFGTIKNNLPEGPGKIDNWRKYMQLFPRAISKIPKIEGQDETNVRAFLHYALNSKEVKSQIGLVNLVNRLKTLAYLQMFPSELLSIDSSVSGPSAPKENIHDDGYGVSYAPFGEGTIIDISDDDWKYMMAVSPLPDYDGGKKGGSKKKSKNTSQKKGGFLKGILKKITTCDCDKKGKRKDNKTRRRGGKKFTVRKNKKSGGKHTYRKKKGGKKQKRVRFTIKN